MNPEKIFQKIQEILDDEFHAVIHRVDIKISFALDTNEFCKFVEILKKEFGLNFLFYFSKEKTFNDIVNTILMAKK